MLGVVDACFLIDWSRYRRRELLASLFEVILVHEEVLAQLRSLQPSTLPHASWLGAR